MAFLFLLLVAASSPPQQQSGQPQAQAEQAVANSLNRIAGTLERDNEAKGYTADCEQGRDNRRSDLCAQWKAADAARESADWTRRAFYLGIAGAVLGLGTLGAAIAAALFAWRSVTHGRAQLRASFGSKNERVSQESDIKYVARMDLFNRGQTPADNVTVSSEAWIVQRRRRETVLSSHPPTYIGTIAKDGMLDLKQDIPLTAARRRAVKSGRAHLHAEFKVVFHDAFGVRWQYHHNFTFNEESLQGGRISTFRCFHIREGQRDHAYKSGRLSEAWKLHDSAPR